jgi:signal transduction histidine kinase
MPRNPIAGYVRRRLHRRIFMWFGATILFTAALAAVVMVMFAPKDGWSWKNEWVRGQSFIRAEFGRIWDQPEARDALARRISEELDLEVTLRDAAQHPIARFGPACSLRHPLRVSIERGGEVIGSVEACSDRYATNHVHALIPMLLVILMLWGASGKIARRLARPLGELVRVTGEIGRGKLDSRAEIGRWTPDEVSVLGEAINDMAARIQRQLEDQRALLAAVSHELRTPLGHLRLLVEIARGGGADAKTLSEIEQEIVEIDSLVGELLASARLDFTAIQPRALDAKDLAERALERAGLSKDRLAIEGGPTHFEADPTLVARALANLIENAGKHGGGVTALRIKAETHALRFEVDDAGGGFLEGETERVFQPFYRRPVNPNGDKDQASLGLGLGLSLVRRIAEAHGGRAFAENKSEGGARVGFEIPASARPASEA